MKFDVNVRFGSKADARHHPKQAMPDNSLDIFVKKIAHGWVKQ